VTDAIELLHARLRAENAVVDDNGSIRPITVIMVTGWNAQRDKSHLQIAIGGFGNLASATEGKGTSQ
jgi:hypothetical protein